MWIPDVTTCAGRRSRAQLVAGLSFTLLIALTACDGQRASTSSGVAAPISSSSAFFVSGSPTVYAGAAISPDMHAVLEWTRTGSIAAGTIELTGSPQPITVVGPGTYPLSISFEGSSFRGSVDVGAQAVPISGQLTAAGVDLMFNASTAMYPTLSFTSIGPGGYSYPPSYPAG